MTKKGVLEKGFAVLAVAAAALVFIFAVVMPILSSFLTELWWFEDIGQKAVFVKRIFTAVSTGAIAFAAACAIMLLNALIIRRTMASEREAGRRKYPDHFDADDCGISDCRCHCRPFCGRKLDESAAVPA